MERPLFHRPRQERYSDRLKRLAGVVVGAARPYDIFSGYKYDQFEQVFANLSGEAVKIGEQSLDEFNIKKHSHFLPKNIKTVGIQDIDGVSRLVDVAGNPLNDESVGLILVANVKKDEAMGVAFAAARALSEGGLLVWEGGDDKDDYAKVVQRGLDSIYEHRTFLPPHTIDMIFRKPEPMLEEMSFVYGGNKF